jgi:hypothetical protein
MSRIRGDGLCAKAGAERPPGFAPGRSTGRAISLAGSVSYRCLPRLCRAFRRHSRAAFSTPVGHRNPPAAAGPRILPQHCADAASPSVEAAKSRPGRGVLAKGSRTARLPPSSHANRRHAANSPSYKHTSIVARRVFRQRAATAIDCGACRSASSSTRFFARVCLREIYGCAGERLEGK